MTRKFTRTRSLLFPLAVGSGLLLAFASAAQAPAAGTLDPSFGTGGKVFRNLTSPATTPDEAKAVVVLPNGKLVVAGQHDGGVEVVRLNADGTPDTSFGTGGRVAYDFGPSTYGGVTSTLPSRVKELQVQPDGKFVLVGTTGTAGYCARLLATGALDATFATGGVTKIMPGSRGTTIFDVGRQTNGKYLVFNNVHQLSREAGAVFRIQSDGTPDFAFGQPYLVFSPALTHAYCTSGVVRPDDKVLAGGYTIGSIFNPTVLGIRAGVAQLLPEGGFDTAFGTNGYAMLPFNATATGPFLNTSCQDVALQPDGKILLAGAVETVSQQSFAFQQPQGLVARFNANGTLDTSFGAGLGYVAVQFPGYTQQCLTRLLVQPDGKILASGSASAAANEADFALVRLNADGTPDAAFGTAGQVVLHEGPQDLVRAIALQPDGNIVAVGGTGTGGGTTRVWHADYDENYAGNPQNGRFAVLRFLGGQALATVPAALAAQVTLHPNPATNALTVSLPAALRQQPVRAELLSVLGQSLLVQTWPAHAATHALALPALRPGVYTLRLQTEAGVVIKRVAVE